MQTQLPLFTENVQFINDRVGVFQKDGFVYYLHNGDPLFCHQVNDRNGYRLFTANLVEVGLCLPSELARVFGVSARSVQMNAKNLRDKGMKYFLNREDNRGKCYKLTDELFVKAQSMLDSGIAVRVIASEFGVTEAAIRHHMRTGKLKKKI